MYVHTTFDGVHQIKYFFFMCLLLPGQVLYRKYKRKPVILYFLSPLVCVYTAALWEINTGLLKYVL